MLAYSPEELYALREHVYHKHSLRILDPSTCALVRELRLNRRRKRGQRGGSNKHKTADPSVNIKDNHKNKHEDNRRNIQILLTNAQSLKNKEYILRDQIDQINADFVVVTETWLCEEDNIWAECSQFNRDGYKIKTAHRINRAGGGIAVIYKDQLKVDLIDSGNSLSFQYMVCVICIDNTVLTLLALYHPPYSKKNPVTVSMFIDEFTQFLPDYLVKYKNLVVLGDFNLHLETEEPDVRLFKDIVDAMGLIPNVNIPTHKAGHTLDQIYTVIESEIAVNECHQGLMLSDHYIVQCYASIPKKATTTTKLVSSRNLRNIDIVAFSNDINCQAVEFSNIDKAVQTLNAELLRVLDKHAPTKEHKIVVRKMQPWYEDHVKNQKKVVRKREQIWRKYRETHQWKAYRIERNRYNRMLAGSKLRSISNKVKECGSDTKKLYNLVNNITGRVKANPMPTSESEESLAEKFADYFLSKIKGIRDNLSTCPTYSPVCRDTTPFKSFKPITEEEIVKTIRSMPSKSCENDIIPTKLLKEILPTIAGTLTSIINLSLTEGVFPNEWKSAIVRPLLKKQGLEHTVKNYRPVSNLPFMSKVVEKCMLNQFNDHCQDNHLLPDYQSAYRKNFSCETALVKLHDDILWSMEKQHVTAIIAIDLSVAFDTVDHDILLDVMSKNFGISDTALKWYDSYLRPRNLQVNVGNSYSSKRPLEFSVPQGSCAGPVLYSVYASTMQHVVPTNIDIHGYADDHALKKSFPGSSINDESITIQALQTITVDIKEWMDLNRLKMNNDKTEFILIGSRQQLSNTVTSEININGELIKKSRSIKYLGAHFDESLTFKEMLRNKCRTAMGNLQKLKKIRNSLTIEASKTIALGLVISHLDYANALYAGLPKKDIKKLQVIQNMAAKIVIKSGKYDSSTEALKTLHWLPIHLRINYKVLVLMFKCIHGIAPNYLCDKIILSNPIRQGLRSENNVYTVVIPFTKHTTFADRAFSVNGPKLWNSLPNELRSVTDFKSFKSNLKTYLFKMF